MIHCLGRTVTPAVCATQTSQTPSHWRTPVQVCKEQHSVISSACDEKIPFMLMWVVAFWNFPPSRNARWSGLLWLVSYKRSRALIGENVVQRKRLKYSVIDNMTNMTLFTSWSQTGIFPLYHHYNNTWKFGCDWYSDFQRNIFLRTHQTFNAFMIKRHIFYFCIP